MADTNVGAGDKAVVQTGTGAAATGSVTPPPPTTNPGLSGQSAGVGPGVVGITTSSAPGVYGQSMGSGPGVMGISSSGVVVDSLLDGGLEAAATKTAATYPNSAAIFIGAVAITGALTTGALTGSTAKFSGDVTAEDIVLTGADCAEEFDLQGGEGIEPGSVVVFAEGGELSLSAEPYNRRVAGVISGAGAFRPGVILDRRRSSEGRAPVALVGKVYCKVDAEYGAIEVGDSLTTSPTEGCAMKVSEPARAFGAVIGKALAAHRDGRGMIPILVSLQ